MLFMTLHLIDCITFQAQLTILETEKSAAVHSLTQEKSSLEFALDELRIQHDELAQRVASEGVDAKALLDKLEQVSTVGYYIQGVKISYPRASRIKMNNPGSDKFQSQLPLHGIFYNEIGY